MSDKGNKEEEEKVGTLCTLQFEQLSRYTARRVKTTSNYILFQKCVNLHEWMWKWNLYGSKRTDSLIYWRRPLFGSGMNAARPPQSERKITAASCLHIVPSVSPLILSAS